MELRVSMSSSFCGEKDTTCVRALSKSVQYISEHALFHATALNDPTNFIESMKEGKVTVSDVKVDNAKKKVAFRVIMDVPYRNPQDVTVRDMKQTCHTLCRVFEGDIAKVWKTDPALTRFPCTKGKSKSEGEGEVRLTNIRVESCRTCIDYSLLS